MESLELSTSFPSSAAEVYATWVSAEGHTEMTGAEATAQGEPGADFTAWDGYISGRTLAVEPGRRLLQTWRTVEFPDGAPDSSLEISFADVEGRAQVTLRQSVLPEGGAAKYTEGWAQFYFEPMKVYFERG